MVSDYKPLYKRSPPLISPPRKRGGAGGGVWETTHTFPLEFKFRVQALACVVTKQQPEGCTLNFLRVKKGRSENCCGLRSIPAVSYCVAGDAEAVAVWVALGSNGVVRNFLATAKALS